MMQGSWKRLAGLGFILALLFAGCGEKRVPTEEVVRQAEELIQVGQLESAILLLERRLEEEPNRVDLLEPLAFAQVARKDPFLAAITFKRIADLVPDQPEYLLYAAKLLEEADDARGATALMRSYLDVRPEDRAVWVGLAELEAAIGQTSAALEAYLAAEQMEPRALQQLAIARLYLLAGNLAQAQAWFARSLAGDPELRAPALLGLLETAFRARQFNEAQELLQQMDAEFPGVVDASPIADVRGQLADWQSRREAALAALAELERQRTAKPAESDQEVAAGETPAAEDAEPAEQTAVEEPSVDAATVQVDPADQSAPESGGQEPVPAAGPLTEARRLRDAGDLTAAIRAYRQFLVGNDSLGPVWAELSELHLQAGDARWAQATASEAARRDPENPAYTLLFLRAAKLNLDAERYIREVEDACRRFPTHPPLILTLARAYAEEGIIRNARMLYLRYLELIPIGDPSYPEISAELEALGG